MPSTFWGCKLRMSDYYHHIRYDIRPLLPKQCGKILDVGAGSGATLAWLKTIYPGAQTTGVELNPAMSNELQRNADVAMIGNIDECIPKLSRYDLILLLDVLEHLADSVASLRQLTRLLQPDGHIIVSVPNIAHLSVSLPLLFRRRFTYQDAGILDRTHLRFFVEDTAVRLMNEADLVVCAGITVGLGGPKARFLHRATGGLLRHHLTKQYIMLGRRTATGDQPTVKWMNG